MTLLLSQPTCVDSVPLNQNGQLRSGDNKKFKMILLTTFMCFFFNWGPAQYKQYLIFNRGPAQLSIKACPNT